MHKVREPVVTSLLFALTTVISYRRPCEADDPESD